MDDFIYLDHHATTPCDPRVMAVMRPYFEEWYGNPVSLHHTAGQQAHQAVEQARTQVAAGIGVEPHEIIFTSGATESNNLALLGMARQYGLMRKRIVTTPIEHKAVLEPCRWLATQGYELVLLKVLPDGRVDLDHAQTVITEDTLFVSVQAANHEIGTIQALASIGAMAREVGAFFHTDAAQAVGKIPVDVQSWDVDFLSLSSHKLYGPKGIGALYIRGGPTVTPIQPLFFGGGQEKGIRSGTLNVPAIVGLGEAMRLSVAEMPQEVRRLRLVRDNFERQLLTAIPIIERNGSFEHRLPHNSSLTITGIDAETLILNLRQLALSVGSACTSGALEPSYVLMAIGLTREQAYSTLRIGLGRYTKEGDVSQAVEALVAEVTQLQESLG